MATLPTCTLYATLTWRRRGQGPGEVLLRVDVAGLCHSDLHILDGMFLREAAAKKAGRPMQPLALSHEIGGTVVGLGEGVSSVTVGKQYVLYPWLGCGSCIQCSDPTSDEIFCESPFMLQASWCRVLCLKVESLWPQAWAALATTVLTTTAVSQATSSCRIRSISSIQEIVIWRSPLRTPAVASLPFQL